MIGADRHTGAAIKGETHIAQSIRDILTTPIGSRVMRRDYGSRLPDLIDTPVSAATVIEFFAAAAEALVKWEPRITLTRVLLSEARAAGSVALSIEYRINDVAGETGVVIEGAAR